MKKGTILIISGLLLITAAFCLVGYNLYESYKAGQASDSVMEELEQAIEAENVKDDDEDSVMEELEQAIEAENVKDDDEASPDSEDGHLPSGISDGSNTGGNASVNQKSDLGENLGEIYPDRDMPTIRINDLAYIGWISIPSLSLRLPILGDWNYDMLTVSPARYSGTVYQNNMIIGGHSYITHFRGLRGIAPGASVTFFDTEGYEYKYEVAYVMNLNPNQGLVLSDEEHEDWDLTLFTCNTGGQTRCVVRCVCVE